jgi:hypothetical protein
MERGSHGEILADQDITQQNNCRFEAVKSYASYDI